MYVQHSNTETYSTCRVLYIMYDSVKNQRWYGMFQVWLESNLPPDLLYIEVIFYTEIYSNLHID